MSKTSIKPSSTKKFLTRYGSMKTSDFIGDGIDAWFQSPGLIPTSVHVNHAHQDKSEYSIATDGTVIFNSPPEKGAMITLISLTTEDHIHRIGYEEANEILTLHFKDVRLRKNNPTLEKTWRSYQSIKKLAK